MHALQGVRSNDGSQVDHVLTVSTAPAFCLLAQPLPSSSVFCLLALSSCTAF